MSHQTNEERCLAAVDEAREEVTREKEAIVSVK